jgi:hypothetical protein
MLYDTPGEAWSLAIDASEATRSAQVVYRKDGCYGRCYGTTSAREWYYAGLPDAELGTSRTLDGVGYCVFNRIVHPVGP